MVTLNIQSRSQNIEEKGPEVVPELLKTGNLKKLGLNNPADYGNNSVSDPDASTEDSLGDDDPDKIYFKSIEAL